MKASIEVPTLVSGLLLLGFGLLAVWVLAGHQLVTPIPMWFAAVLMLAGIVGLLVSLAGRADRRD